MSDFMSGIATIGVKELINCMHTPVFSIGTNDFIQYMLAVDRTNEKVAELYLPYHPSVLRSIKKVVETANANGIEVSICGDMAHDERHIPFLLGIGVRILSMEPMYLPKIQKAISGIKLQEAEKLADTLLEQPKVSSIAKIVFKDNDELIHGHVRA